MTGVTSHSALERRGIVFANLSLITIREDPGLLVTSEVIFWILLTLGLLCNTILTAVIIKHRKHLLEIPSNILLLSLALSGILTSLATMGLHISVRVSAEEFSAAVIVARSENLVTEGKAVISHWTIAALAVCNYFGVVHPMKFRAWVTKKKVLIIVVAMWILSAVLTIPMLMTTPIRHLVRDKNLVFEDDGKRNVLVEYGLALDFISNFPPVASIVILYPLILFHLRKRKNMSERSEQFRTKIRKSMKHITLTYLLFFVYVIFDLIITFQLYRFIFSDILENIPPDTSRLDVRFFVFSYEPFQAIYVILNPFMHALLTENYRKYYVPDLCGRKSLNKDSSIEIC